MDFWQIIAVLTTICAYFIAISELYQVVLQKKAILRIEKRLETFDITDVSNSSKLALERLENALVGQLEPIRDKILMIDMTEMPHLIGEKVKEAIMEYGASIDLNPVIDALGASIVTNIQAAIPEMIGNAGEAMTEQEMAMIERAQENPIGTLLHMGMKHMAKTQQPAAQQPNTGQIKI